MTAVYNAWTKSEELEKWFLTKAVFFKEVDVKVSPSANVLQNANMNGIGLLKAGLNKEQLHKQMEIHKRLYFS